MFSLRKIIVLLFSLSIILSAQASAQTISVSLHDAAIAESAAIDEANKLGVTICISKDVLKSNGYYIQGRTHADGSINIYIYGIAAANKASGRSVEDEARKTVRHEYRHYQQLKYAGYDIFQEVDHSSIRGYVSDPLEQDAEKYATDGIGYPLAEVISAVKEGRSLKK